MTSWQVMISGKYLALYWTSSAWVPWTQYPPQTWKRMRSAQELAELCLLTSLKDFHLIFSPSSLWLWQCVQRQAWRSCRTWISKPLRIVENWQCRRMKIHRRNVPKPVITAKSWPGWLSGDCLLFGDWIQIVDKEINVCWQSKFRIRLVP